MRRRADRRRRSRGFTLVEVLIAVVVVAVAMPALVLVFNQQIDGTAYLRDRAMAQYVASNRLAELRLAQLSGRPLPRTAVRGDTEMAGRRWYWTVDSEATEVPDLMRVTVAVGNAADTQPLSTLVALLGSGEDEAAGP